MYVYIQELKSQSKSAAFLDISNLYDGGTVAYTGDVVRELFAVRTYTKTLREDGHGPFAYKVLATESGENVVRLDDCRLVMAGPDKTVFPVGEHLVVLHNPTNKTVTMSGGHAELLAVAEKWLREVSVERSAD